MALEKKTLSFALAKGIDEKSSNPSRAPDALVKADNVVFNKKGQAQKRGAFVQTNNTRDIIGDGDISVGKAISKFQDETLILDGSNLYTKVAGTGLFDKGTYVPCTLENKVKRRQIDRRQSNAQIAEANGIRVYVWEEYEFLYSNTAKYSVYADVEHIATGAILVSRHLVGEQAGAIDTNSVANAACLYRFGQPQCSAIGNRIFIVFKRYAVNNYFRYTSVDCASVTAAAGTIGANAELDDNGGTPIRLDDNAPVFEMDHCSGSTYSDAIVCAYVEYGTNLVVTYFVASGSTLAGSSQAITVSSGPTFNGYNARDAVSSFTPNGLMIKSLDDASGGASYSIVVGYTFTDLGVKKVKLTAIKDDLSAQNAYTSDNSYPNGATGNLWLLCGTAGCTADEASTAAIFCTLWPEGATEDYVSGVSGVLDEGLGHGVQQTPYTTTVLRAGMVAEHFIRSYTINRNTGYFSITTNKTVGYNACVTSDFFRFNSKLYCVVSQVNDNSLYSDFSGTNTVDRGLSNNSVLLNSEWATLAPPNGEDAITMATALGRETRRLWHGTQRVTSRDSATRFVFGASRFHGYEHYPAGQYSTTDFPDNSFGISFFDVDFDPARTLASVDVENTWAGTGGFLHGYDGKQVFENNFICYPSIRKLTQRPISNQTYTSGTTAGIPLGKTVRYCAIYVWTDANGNIQQSRPSEFVEIVTVAGQAMLLDSIPTPSTGYTANTVYATSGGDGTGCTIKVTAVGGSGEVTGALIFNAGSGYAAANVLTLTGAGATVRVSHIGLLSSIGVQVYVPSFSRKSDLIVEIYRNDAEGGDLFYLAGSTPVRAVPIRSYVSYYDSPADYAKISESSAELYTDLGIPPHGFIGSCTDLIRHQNKLFAAGIDDTVYMSRVIVEAGDPSFPASTPAFQINLSGDPSRITAIESNMDHLLIFTADNGFYTTGSGPDALGQGGFRAPRLFAADQGAKAGAGHTDSALGVFYQTDRGIYLVGRDMRIAYIGAAVEDTVGANTAIKMLRHDDDNSVRIMLQAASPGSSGTDVYCVYNYYFKQWSTFGIARLSPYQVDEVYDGSMFQRLTSDGKQYEQNNALFQDHNVTGGTANYNMTIQTGFISPTGLMKKDRTYRVMFLGEYVGNHDIDLVIYHDYSASASQTVEKTLSGAPTGAYLLRAHVEKQKARAIQLKLVLTAAGQCARIEGFAFEVGIRPEQTTFKTIAERTF